MNPIATTAEPSICQALLCLDLVCFPVLGHVCARGARVALQGAQNDLWFLGRLARQSYHYPSTSHTIAACIHVCFLITEVLNHDFTVWELGNLRACAPATLLRCGPILKFILRHSCLPIDTRKGVHKTWMPCVVMSCHCLPVSGLWISIEACTETCMARGMCAFICRLSDHRSID